MSDPLAPSMDLSALLAMIEECASHLVATDGEPSPDFTAAHQTLSRIRGMVAAIQTHALPDPRAYLKTIDDQVVLFQQQLAEVQLTLTQALDHDDRARQHIKAYQKHRST